MEKKFLQGKKGDEPEWIQDISCYFLTYRKNGKSDEYKKNLHDLFSEYEMDGMEPDKAWKKAKKVLDCFEI
jgi:hypothetical protein